MWALLSELNTGSSRVKSFEGLKVSRLMQDSLLSPLDGGERLRRGTRGDVCDEVGF
jgi:hypothetical protein